MQSTQITHIAALLTEDPDIFMELDTSLVDLQSNTDTQMQADTETDEADSEENKNLSAQLKAEREAQQKRRNTLRPQINDLDKNLQDLQTELTQSQNDTDQINDKAFNSLNSEIRDIKRLTTDIANML